MNTMQPPPWPCSRRLPHYMAHVLPGDSYVCSECGKDTNPRRIYFLTIKKTETRPATVVPFWVKS